MAPEKTVLSPAVRTLAILGGAVSWAVFFGLIGALTERAWIGATSGTVIGGIIGYGFTRNLIGRVVIWVSVFAVIGGMLGPGCDADPCTSAVGGAVIGSLFGWFGWTAALMLVIGMAGASLGSSLGPLGAAAGLVLGAVVAWLAVHLDRKTAAREGLDDWNLS